jgi:D-amino-acid oxidase
VTAPDVHEWLLDQSDPRRLVYVVPRENDVVLGGTAEEGAEDRTPDPSETDAIRARCAALVPALRDAPVVAVAVGLRPVRPQVRLEAEGRVVHCYGHGGAGVTLAWGCAVEVAALLGADGDRYAAAR